MSQNGNRLSHTLECPRAPLCIHMPDGSTKMLGGSNGNENHNGVEGADHQNQIVRVDFQSFPDGTKLELVRGPSSGELELLVWSGEKERVERTYAFDGKVFAPPVIDSGVATKLYLPRNIRCCGTAAELLHRLSQRLLNFVDVSESEAWLISNYVLYTWVFDRFHMACYLWIVGGYGCGKTTVLRFLSRICRRGIIVGDASPAFLYHLLGAIRPTLILDEYETTQAGRAREVNRVLRLGSTRDTAVGRTTGATARLHDVFCPKIVASVELANDAALNSRAIAIGLLPSNKRMPPLEEAQLEALAEEFQPELLMFRLRYFEVARVNQQLTLSDPRMTDVLRALSLPLFNDANLEARLVNVLEPHAEAASVDRSFEPENIVLRALMRVCHSEGGEVTCAQINAYVINVVDELGEDYKISDRKVGEMLRSKFGIPTKKLGNWGRGIELTRATRRRIHELAARCGVTKGDIIDRRAVQSGYGGYPCKLCDEFGLLVDVPGGRPLKVIAPPPAHTRRHSLWER